MTVLLLRLCGGRGGGAAGVDSYCTPVRGAAVGGGGGGAHSVLVAPRSSARTSISCPRLHPAVDPAASTASADSVLLISAGKAVPANEAGYGGDAYAWRVTVPK